MIDLLKKHIPLSKVLMTLWLLLVLGLSFAFTWISFYFAFDNEILDPQRVLFLKWVYVVLMAQAVIVSLLLPFRWFNLIRYQISVFILGFALFFPPTALLVYHWEVATTGSFELLELTETRIVDEESGKVVGIRISGDIVADTPVEIFTTDLPLQLYPKRVVAPDGFHGAASCLPILRYSGGSIFIDTRPTPHFFDFYATDGRIGPQCSEHRGTPTNYTGDSRRTFARRKWGIFRPTVRIYYPFGLDSLEGQYYFEDFE